MEIIRLENVNYTYDGDNPVHAVKDVSLAVSEGEFVALCGHNGSGKSTLAKLLNGLIEADSGSITVCGLDVTNPENLNAVRESVGIVFQNPDNQMVAAIIEDDVAFGPENIGIPSDEIRARVDTALKEVGMTEYAERTASRLSGGQKQRIAIAGILALRPKIIVLDESTAMLDPKGRREVLSVAKRLNREQGITVILITHFMEDAADADRIIVMNEGSVIMEGGKELFSSRASELEAVGLDIPRAAYLAKLLRSKGVPVPESVVTEEELEDAICSSPFSFEPAGQERLINESLREEKENADDSAENSVPFNGGGLSENAGASVSDSAAVYVKNLSFSYSPNTTFRTDALTEVSCRIEDGDFLGIIGHTGSGKSTFIQHLNGLIKIQIPTKKQLKRGAEPQGEAWVGDIDLKSKYDHKALRARVGMVFQYPEHQLFDETVLKDVGFGPRNLGLSKEEADARAEEAIRAVGLDFDAVKDASPFELSGGQKRRAAIAGVIAMRPEILILDEPTAGLDPRGKHEIMSLILKIKAETTPTVIMISHDMDEISKYCNKVLVLNRGKSVFELPPAELYRRADALLEMGLDVPTVTRITRGLIGKGIDLPKNLYDAEEFARQIARLAGGHA